MKVISKSIIMFLLFSLAGSTQAGVLGITGVRLEWAANYDDNILRYSENDIDKFVEGTEVNSSLLSSYDDWNNELRVKLYGDVSVKGVEPIKFRYFGKISSFYRNSFNNYGTHTFIADFTATDKVGFGLRYFYMPDYYLREYRDKDTDSYQSCTFDDHQAGVNIDYKIDKTIQISIIGQYEEIYYNGYFTEYDSELLSISGEIDKRVTHNLRCSFLAGMTSADNVGYVPISSAAQSNYFTEDTEYGDGSYKEEIFQGEIRYRFRKLLGQDTWMGIQYKLRHRIYTTNNALSSDPFHAGRMDDRHRLVISADRKLMNRLDGFLNYTYEWRNSESDNPSVAKVKNFRQNVMTLGLEYSFK